MSDTEPNGMPIGPALMFGKSADGLRLIELANFSEFGNVMGVEVLTAFAQCFVHVDRLMSMVSFGYVSHKHHGESSVAAGRDLHTMVWFTIGTIRELSFAIRGLRNALYKKGIFDKDAEHWKQLLEIADRWDANSIFKLVRDKAAFHVDPKVLTKGIEVMMKETRDAELFRGDGDKQVQTSFSFGNLAIHNGLGWDDMESYGAFLAQVSNDHGVVLQAVQLAFIDATDALGIASFEKPGGHGTWNPLLVLKRCASAVSRLARGAARSFWRKLNTR